MTDSAKRAENDRKIQKICQMMSDRMMSLRAEPAGIELGPNSDGEIDGESESQVVRVVLREEYRSIIKPRMLHEADGFAQETHGVCDHEIEMGSKGALWWDDLVIFDQAREGMEDWVYTCVVVNPNHMEVLVEQLAKKPVIDREKRAGDLEQLQRDMQMGI